MPGAVTMTSIDFPGLTLLLEDICADVAQLVLRARSNGLSAIVKPDGSPQTSADVAAEEAIAGSLISALPQMPIVGEEFGERGGDSGSTGALFFLVDALDGTKEFLRGGDDFTINIALIGDSYPLLGVVCAPARRLLYLGYGGRAEIVTLGTSFRPVARRAIAVSNCNGNPVIVASKSHSNLATEKFKEQFGHPELVSVGSSLKFCHVASGNAHIYPRMGTTMQWDTAAGDAILRAAGGRTENLEGGVLRYGRNFCGDGVRPYSNPHFVAEGSTPWRSLVSNQSGCSE